MANGTSSRGTALVTGASSGIGAVYADRLAGRGYDLILVARNQTRMDELATNLQAQHAIKAETMVADLTDPSALAAVETRLREDAAISLLVNNAGMSISGSFIEADIEAMMTMTQLNLVAPVRLAHAAGRAFAEHGRGALINIASVLALIHESDNGTYGASKAYILALSRSLAHQFEPRGVRVQVVLPGATRTEIFERSGGSIDNVPAHIIMEVDDMVDAALAGFDQGEKVTIPALENIGLWETFDSARQAMLPNLSTHTPASRYTNR